MAPTFFEMATTLKNLGAKWLSEKKVNFTPCYYNSAKKGNNNSSKAVIQEGQFSNHCWYSAEATCFLHLQTDIRTSGSWRE